MAVVGALGILTILVVTLLLGLIITSISRKLKISNILLLTLTGILLGRCVYIKDWVSMSYETVLTIAVLTLVLVVFDGSSRFKTRSLDTLSFSALRLSGLFLFFNLLIVSSITTFLFFEFNAINILYTLIFATIISGTDPASIFIMLQERTNKVIDFLKIEGILNTPIMVIIPFIFLDVINQILNNSVINFEAHLTAFLGQILTGIGSGIVIGLIFFKGMKKFSEKTSGVTVICAALLAYILAEHLRGNGVLAVAVLGVMFGTFYMSDKKILQDFNVMLSNSLEILVFLLLGFIVNLDIDMTFFLKSLIIFSAIIISRALAVGILMKQYTLEERLFIIFSMPKGIAVAVLIFSLSLINVPQLNLINNLLILIIIYSLILATIVNRFSEKFINVKLAEHK